MLWRGAPPREVKQHNRASGRAAPRTPMRIVVASGRHRNLNVSAATLVTSRQQSAQSAAHSGISPYQVRSMTEKRRGREERLSRQISCEE